MNTQIIHRGRASCLVLTALLVGCAHPPERVEVDPSSFARWDSAGVVIVESASEVASTELRWTVADEPSFEIGPVAEGQHQSIPLSVGVTRSGDKTVVVDQRAVDVSFFGREGEFLFRVFGDRGEEPGELLGIHLVPSLAADSLLLWDGRNARFTLLAPDGSGFRVIPPGEPGRGDDATMYERTRAEWGLDGLMYQGLVGDVLLTKATDASDLSGLIDRGVMEANDVFWLENLYDGERVEVGEFEGSRVLFATTAAELGEDFVERDSFTLPPMAPPVAAPFRTPASAAPARGSFVFTKGEGPEIMRLGEDGALLSIMRLREPRSVTAGDVEAFIEWRAGDLEPGRGTPADLRAMVDRLPIPEVWPGFQRLLVDTEGWTWAQQYHYDPSQLNRWVVFDPEGRAHGMVETPAGLYIGFIGEDFILGVARDEQNVQFVREYSLDRGASGVP